MTHLAEVSFAGFLAKHNLHLAAVNHFILLQPAFACSKLAIEIRTKCEMCLKLTIKKPERRHLHSSGVFIVNFEYISHLVLLFLLLTLNM